MEKQYYYSELEHHGILGMRWGVRRTEYLRKRRERLEGKRNSYQEKSRVARNKAEKVHNDYDLADSNKYTEKSIKYDNKAAKYRKKVSNENDQAKRDSKGTDKIPTVIHKKNNCEILVTMRFDDFMRLYREFEAGMTIRD